MKRYLIVMAVLSLSLIFSGMAIAAEKSVVPKAGEKMMVTPGAAKVVKKPQCPPGYELTQQISEGVFQCRRRQPANPCPSGYTVKWGPCGSPPSLAASSEPQYQSCVFSCVPQVPTFKLDCAAGYFSSVGACEAMCQKVPQ
ncbi:MAG: hypothetical protein HZA17_03550 [Nitrospirae bacterium]|nr:hypothetical protein [Nitrospirota bacterium]